MAITATWNKQRRRRLSIKLSRLRPEIAAELRPAVEKNAQQVNAAQKRLVEVVDGDLQDSLTYYPVKGFDGLRWRVVAGDEQAFYARMVEFGVPGRKRSPFFYPAYRSVRRAMRARMSRATKKAIKRVARMK